MLKNILGKKYLVQLLSALCGIIVLTVIIVSGFQLHTTNFALLKVLNSSTLSILQQLQKLNDNNIANNVNVFIAEEFFYNKTPASITDFLYSDLLLGIDELNAARKDVNNIAVLKGFAKSIVIYNKNRETAISSSAGVITKNTYYKNSILDVNLDFYNNIINDGYDNIFISPYDNKLLFPDENVISFVKLVKDNNKTIGAIILNFSMNNIIDVFEKNTFGGANLSIVDNDDIIASNNFEYLKMDGEEYKSRFSGNDGTLDDSENNRVVLYTKSPIYGWLYVLELPYDVVYSDLIYLRHNIVLYTIVIVIILLIIGGYFSIRLYRPVSELTSSILKKTGKNISELEFSFIDKEFDRLLNSSNEIINQNLQALINNLFSEIISGNIKTKNELSSRFKVVSINDDFKFFKLILTDFSFSSDNAEISAKNEILILKFMNEFLKLSNDDGMAYTIRNGQNKLITLIMVSKHEDLKTFLYTADEAYKESNGSYNLLESDIYEDILSTNTVFSKLLQMSKYSFILGYGNKITEKTYSEYEKAVIPSSFGKLDDFEGLLLSRKTDDAKEYLNEISNYISKNKINITYTQDLLFRVNLIIFKVGNQLKIFDGEDVKNRLLKEFNNIENMGDTVHWMNKLIEQFKVTEENFKKKIMDSFVENILAYIDENIEKNLTLEIISKEFKISANYLSKVFKDETGINFSNFIINKKFERAKYLIVNYNNLNMTEISNRVGYYNVSYFTKLFKERYGVTPMQYRKMNRGE